MKKICKNSMYGMKTGYPICTKPPEFTNSKIPIKRYFYNQQVKLAFFLYN